MVDFGNILKTQRLKADMTQAQLAQKLGITNLSSVPMRQGYGCRHMIS